MNYPDAAAEAEPVIRGLAYRLATSPAERDDLAQIGRTAAWQAHASFDGRGQVVARMCVKARWAMIDHLRATGPYRRGGTPRHAAVSIDSPDGDDLTIADRLTDDTPGPEQVAIARDEVARVAAALGEMRPSDAEAIRACWDGDQTAVAHRQGVTPAAISFRRRRALAKLREVA